MELSDILEVYEGVLIPIENRQGVSLGTVRERISDSSFFDYAGWMDYSFFHVAVFHSIIDDPFDPIETVYADVYSIGNATSTNPVSGNATWRGVVVGVDASESENKGNVIVGDATITIDNFRNPDADVSFTSLIDQTTNMERNGKSMRRRNQSKTGKLRLGYASNSPFKIGAPAWVTSQLGPAHYKSHLKEPHLLKSLN